MGERKGGEEGRAGEEREERGSRCGKLLILGEAGYLDERDVGILYS